MIYFYLKALVGYRSVHLYSNQSVHHANLVKVSTNYERSIILAPLRYRLEASVTPIPSLPPGHFITGLVAHQKVGEAS